MLGQFTYTAYGAAVIPWLLWGSMYTPDQRHSVQKEGIRVDKTNVQSKISELRQRHGNSHPRSWSSKDRIELRKLESKLNKISGIFFFFIVELP